MNKNKELNKKIKEYDEIDLIDYIRVIKNNIKFITFFTIAIIIITGLLTYYIIPKKYELEGVIQTGVTENKTPLIEKKEIISIIKQKGSLNAILNKLKENDKYNLWNDVSILSKNDFSIYDENIFLIINSKNRNPQKSKELIKEISNFIIEIDDKEYQKNIKYIEENKSILEEKLSLTEQHLNENNILLYKLNSDIVNLSPNNQANSLALQAYIASRDTIKERVYIYKQQVNDLKADINNINNKKDTFRKAKLVTEPFIQNSSSIPSLKINLIIALILGLFIGIIISFILEWWKDNKKRL